MRDAPRQLYSARITHTQRHAYEFTLSSLVGPRLLQPLLHVILAFLFIKFALFLCGGILVLLVLRDKIVHIAFSFRELHLIHTFSRIPVEESLATEHRCEVLGDALEHLLTH